MELNYSLTENDYLQYYFFSFRDKDNKWLHMLILLIVAFFFLVITFLLYISKCNFLAGFFGAIGAIFFVFAFNKKFLLRLDQATFERYAYSKFQEEKDMIINLIFDEDQIKISTTDSIEIFNFSDFKIISETRDYFFINLKTNKGIIIPKSHITDVELLRNKVTTITEKIGIKFISELDWKWK